MRSLEHAILGAITSTVLAFTLTGITGLLEAIALFAYGILLSVFIDLDHFVVARYQTGDWSHFRRCVTDPAFAFTEQEQVFDGIATRTMEVYRLLSHVLLGGALVGALILLEPVYAFITAVILYVHVVADLLRDARIA